MPPTSSSRRAHGRRDHGESTPSRGPQARSARPRTPEYQSPSTPLNAAGQRALSNLLQSSAMRHLKTHLQQATEKLTETASEANERATDARIRHDRAKARKSAAARQQKTGSRRTKVETDANGDEIVVEYEEEDDDDDDDNDTGIAEKDDDEDNNNDARKLELLEGKVKAATDQMDEKIRTLIDANTKLEWTANVIQDIEKDVEASAAASQAAQRRGGLRTNRRQQVHNDEDEDMVDADADEDDDAGDSDTASPSHPPSHIVQEKLEQGEAEWQTLSLTQKYSTNNTYIGFYRIVHEAQHPGDNIPPVPPPSTWFTHLENPGGDGASATLGQTGGAARSPSPADVDDEIAIERERISLKCPLTLVMFVDPVSSTKCVHSFEREAIEDMINRSSMTVPAGQNDYQGGGRGARARRVRAIACPVCSVKLTLNDLKRDPVIMTRVRRARAAEQREAEEADFERDDGRRRHLKGGRRSGFTVASDDDEEDAAAEVNVQAERMIRIKRERSRLSSRVPQEDIEDD